MLVRVDDTVKLREARNIVVGDLLVPADHDGPLHPLPVLAVDAVVMGARNIVATNEGTILAEGLTMSAMCDAPEQSEHDAIALSEVTRLLSAADVVQLWKNRHGLIRESFSASVIP